MGKGKLTFLYFFVAAISLAAGFLITAFLFSPAKAAFLGNLGGVVGNRGLIDKVGIFVKSFASSTEEIEENILDLPEVLEGDRKIDLGHIEEKKFDISSEETAVVANLEDMTLTLYENGVAVEEISILSKGRPGSPWETPSGKYEVLYKEESHFSSIGEVYMPSSVQFFGNFFIHGWPYYPDGTPVPEGYSGGCIRLSQEEAERVFGFVEKGTPIVVYSDSDKDETRNTAGESYYLIDTNNDPSVRADSYLVADLDTGEVILEEARRQVRPIASVTKLMTALVSLEVVNQYQMASISREAVETEGFAGGLSAGEQIITGDLLYPLLLESSNDSAEALARHYGRKFFIEQMNNKARSVGLDNTFYEDPSGLSEFNVSNAEDLFVLAQHIYKNKKHIFEVTKAENYEGEDHFWKNNAKFLSYEGFMGGKNGFTDEAGKTQIALFSLPLAEFENRNIAIVLLSTDDVVRDVDSLLSYLSEHVSYKTDAASKVGISE